MKALKILIPYLVLSLVGCATKITNISGKYMSSCPLYGKSSLKLMLSEDNSFIYELGYLEEKVTGTWFIKGDSIILESKYFSEDYIANKFPDTPKELTPAYKFSKDENEDVYLLRAGKLFLIEGERVVSECYLFKMK